MKKISMAIFLLFSMAINAEKVDITADHFRADDMTKMAYFEGSARIKQGDSEFKASSIVVYFNNKKRATKYEAKGDVQFDITENGIHYKGQAQKIIYAPNDSKYYFSGDVVLRDLTNDRKISAQIITLDLKTGFADIQGDETTPVRFIFEIEDRK
jgi:lipopolysaccharide export system protein LptA